jgi:S-adenosyl methyltransferase
MADMLVKLKSMYDTSSSPVIWRTHQQIATLFGDFDLLEPGLTWTPLWHPEKAELGTHNAAFAEPSESVIYAGVGRKSKH